jgi:hypothetical protein
MPIPASQLSHDPFIRRFLDGLPRGVAESFTSDQLHAVQRAFGMRYAVPHVVDLRRTVRLLRRTFYVVLLVGRERQGEASRPPSCLPYGVAAAALSAVLLLLL